METVLASGHVLVGKRCLVIAKTWGIAAIGWMDFKGQCNRLVSS